MKIKKLEILGMMLLFFIFLPVFLISAQTAPEFLVSWRAMNYAPPFYQGKILPNKATPIEAGFDLIANNKLVDISKNQITWTINGASSLTKSGVGMKAVSFPGEDTDQTVRITIDYQGSEIDKVFKIPSTKPELVIDAKLPGRNIGLGEYNFTALPFFFNVADIKELAFNWLNNGQTVTGKTDMPESLKINLESRGSPSKTDLSISASARNVFNPLEGAGKKINLTVR